MIFFTIKSSFLGYMIKRILNSCRFIILNLLNSLNKKNNMLARGSQYIPLLYSYQSNFMYQIAKIRITLEQFSESASSLCKAACPTLTRACYMAYWQCIVWRHYIYVSLISHRVFVHVFCLCFVWTIFLT